MNINDKVADGFPVDDPVLRAEAEEAFGGAHVDRMIIMDGHVWASHVIDNTTLDGHTGGRKGVSVWVSIRPLDGEVWAVRTSVNTTSSTSYRVGKKTTHLELKGGAELGLYLVMLYMDYGMVGGGVLAEGFGALRGKLVIGVDGEVTGASGWFQWRKGIVPRKVRKALGIKWRDRKKRITWSVDGDRGGLLWKIDGFGGTQGSLDFISRVMSGTLVK